MVENNKVVSSFCWLFHSEISKTLKPSEKSNICCLQILFTLHVNHKSGYSILLCKQTWAEGMDVILCKSPAGLDHFLFRWVAKPLSSAHFTQTKHCFSDIRSSSSSGSKKEDSWQCMSAVVPFALLISPHSQHS